LNTFREVEIPIKELTPANYDTAPTMINSQYHLMNLSPYSNVGVQICVLNTFYVGAPSGVISFQTNEGGKL